MKKYVSKLTQSIKFQNHLIKEKEKEIAELLKQKDELEKEIKRGENKYEHFKKEMEEGRITDSSYFFGVFDENITNSINNKLEKLNLEIRYKKMEREKIKKKKEMIEKLDEKREAEFNKEQRKKEEKNIENMIQAMRELKKGEEDNAN